ncbi:MAG: hypothetical protein M3P26_06125 [Gemmatimonadota bacterium]|nr:hypothetical protein [Gemmatimonadota bacterium]
MGLSLDALAVGVKEITDLVDASQYDTSSRTRAPHLGEILVWQNTAGYFAATKIEKLKYRGHGADEDVVVFSYAIQPNKSSSFKRPAK